MKETSQKKKGALKKFFSRLMGRGGQEDDPEQSSFQRGHVVRQTAPADIIRPLSSDSYPHNRGVEGKHTANGLTNKKENLRENERHQTRNLPQTPRDITSDSGQTTPSKMPVIKRALSPPDALASMESGQVETTIYRSYRRRSRTMNTSPSHKTMPLAAVCSEKAIHRQSLDLSTVQPSPPIPPSQLPDFRLRTANDELPVVVTKINTGSNSGQSQTKPNSNAENLEAKQSVGVLPPPSKVTSNQDTTPNPEKKSVSSGNHVVCDAQLVMNGQQSTPADSKLPDKPLPKDKPNAFNTAKTELKNTKSANIKTELDIKIHQKRHSANIIQNNQQDAAPKTPSQRDTKINSAPNNPHANGEKKLSEGNTKNTDISSSEKTAVEFQSNTKGPGADKSTRCQKSAFSPVRQRRKLPEVPNDAKFTPSSATQVLKATIQAPARFQHGSVGTKVSAKRQSDPSHAGSKTTTVNPVHSLGTTSNQTTPIVVGNKRDEAASKSSPVAAAHCKSTTHTKILRGNDSSQNEECPSERQGKECKLSRDTEKLKGNLQEQKDINVKEKSSSSQLKPQTNQTLGTIHATNTVEGQAETVLRGKTISSSIQEEDKSNDPRKRVRSLETDVSQVETKPSRNQLPLPKNKQKTQFLSNSAPVKISELSANLIKSARTNQANKLQTRDITTKGESKAKTDNGNNRQSITDIADRKGVAKAPSSKSFCPEDKITTAIRDQRESMATDKKSNEHVTPSGTKFQETSEKNLRFADLTQGSGTESLKQSEKRDTKNIKSKTQTRDKLKKTTACDSWKNNSVPTEAHTQNLNTSQNFQKATASDGTPKDVTRGSSATGKNDLGKTERNHLPKEKIKDKPLDKRENNGPKERNTQKVSEEFQITQAVQHSKGPTTDAKKIRVPNESTPSSNEIPQGDHQTKPKQDLILKDGQKNALTRDQNKPDQSASATEQSLVGKENSRIENNTVKSAISEMNIAEENLLHEDKNSKIGSSMSDQDKLDINLSELDADFAKPLASSTLQRNKKKENVNSQVQNKEVLKEEQNKARESIRQKRLKYFSSQATMRAVVVANVSDSVNNKEPSDVLVTIPNHKPAHKEGNPDQRESIDLGSNINEGSSLPFVVNSKSTKAVCDSVQAPCDTGQISCETEHAERTTEIKTHVKHVKNEESPVEDIRNAANINCLTDAKPRQTSPSAFGETNDDLNSTDACELTEDNLNTTLTAHVDSTLTLLGQHAELDTTLTVSRNAERIPSPEIQLNEGIQGIETPPLGNNAGVLHYHVTIQDNRNGININVDSTADRTVLDLMDVSQDGIQRLQDESFMSERDRSYAIAPELLSMTASTETLFSDTSTIIAGNDWYLGYIPDSTTLLVNTDAFTEDTRSDITCDTTYLVDADAWGQSDDDTTLLPSGVCDPIADPLHTNCRLRHIPLQENTSLSSETNSAQLTARLSSLAGGYPWRRYQELHRSRSQGFTPPWRSGPQDNAPNTQEPPPRSVRSTSVLRTLVQPNYRRNSSTNSVNSTASDSTTQTPGASSTDSNTPAVTTSPSVSLPEALSSSSRIFSTATTAHTPTIGSSAANSVSGRFNSDSSTHMGPSGSTQSLTSPRPIAGSSTTTSCSIPRPIPTSSIGFTNAIIEETSTESSEANESDDNLSSAKGESTKNSSKGKSLASDRNKTLPKSKSADRPVAMVRPRPRLPTALVSSASSITSATSANSAVPRYTPSLMVSSTVSIGSRYSAFTPSASTQSTTSTGVPTRPASAVPSHISAPLLPTTGRRSMTPAAASSVEVSTRAPSGAALGIAGLTSSSMSTAAGINASGRLTTTPLRIPSGLTMPGLSSGITTPDRISNPTTPGRVSRASDDTILESRTADFVFVDEDVNDLSSRQTFRRFGLASTIQPSMRRTRNTHNASAGRSAAAQDNNLTDTFGNVRSLEETVAALRDDIVRVPGALILSVRRNRLVVYLSQDRPNVDGVILFMQENGISRADYEVEILPFGPNGSMHTSHSMQTVAPQAGS